VKPQDHLRKKDMVYEMKWLPLFRALRQQDVLFVSGIEQRPSQGPCTNTSQPDLEQCQGRNVLSSGLDIPDTESCLRTYGQEDRNGCPLHFEKSTLPTCLLEKRSMWEKRNI
jgi:hypothetical protein